MWFLVVSQGVARAGEPAALLAPAPRELVEAERELTDRVLRAEAIGRATTRLQNASVYLEDRCEQAFVARAMVFGKAWRDAAQRARVQADRTQLIAGAHTLLPIMDDARRAEIDTLARRAGVQARSWLEFDALLAKEKLECEAPLKPAVGLASPTPRAVGEDNVPVAIWVLAGTLCPQQQEAGVAVVDGPVCVDLDPACSCEPVAVLPGAVLSP